MLLTELSIQTQREAPSNSRTEGFAFLVRAAYLARDGQPLELARRVANNTRRLADQILGDGSNALDRLPAFFSRLGLDALASSTSGEFFSPLPIGADELLRCPHCGYLSRRELSALRKLPATPEEALPVEKVATPECPTIEALAAYLHIPREQTAKAVMYTRVQDGKFVFAVVRGDMQLSETKLRKVAGDVRAATEGEILAAGAVPGYAAPIGLRDALVVVDDLIPRSPNLVAGANRPGYHLRNVNYPRDFQADHLADIVLPRAGDGCPACTAPLEASSAVVLADENGVCFDDLLLPLAEAHHDEKGLCLPPSIAPFDVYLMSVPGKLLDTSVQAGNLYRELSEAGISVVYDDRNERAGVKFNDADLIGCPVRITVGERGLQNGMVELKPRRAAENRLVPLASLVETVKHALASDNL